MKKIKKQKGFALVEVMLASLVMVVGGVGFMKLQQLGLQTGFNNYARSQGVLLAEDFVEQFRGNVGLLKTQAAGGTVIQGRITSQDTGALTGTADCVSSENEAGCAAGILGFHSYILRHQMKSVASNSALCYVEAASGTGRMRITYVWQDNSKGGSDAVTTCPASFDEHRNPNNSVTIYAQL